MNEPMSPRDKTEAKLYDALVSFNETAQWDMLRLAQMRQYLAEHLANALVPSWLHERKCETAGEEIAHVLLMVGLFPPDWIDAFRIEILAKAGVKYDTCSVCGAAFSLGTFCGTCDFRARMAAEAGGKATAPAATAAPGPTGRVAQLLDAIRTTRGNWSTVRAYRFYRENTRVTDDIPNTQLRAVARGDLRDLAAWGHLLRHEEPGRQFYTLKTVKDRA